jgi:hypothetical protein
LREKERELSNVELRETFAKQDLAQTLRQEQDSVKKLNEDLKLQKLMESRLTEEAVVMKQELATLKGSLEESDRTREMLMRELTRQKDTEVERMRDIQNKRDAEAKMQEKIHQGLLRDKKDLEKRIGDILGKMDE